MRIECMGVTPCSTDHFFADGLDSIRIQSPESKGRARY